MEMVKQAMSDNDDRVLPSIASPFPSENLTAAVGLIISSFAIAKGALAAAAPGNRLYHGGANGFQEHSPTARLGYGPGSGRALPFRGPADLSGCACSVLPSDRPLALLPAPPALGPLRVADRPLGDWHRDPPGRHHRPAPVHRSRHGRRHRRDRR